MPSFLQIYRSPLILAFIVLLLAAFEPVGLQKATTIKTPR